MEVHTPPVDHTHVDDFVVTDIAPELGVDNGPVGPRSRVKGGITRGDDGWYPLNVEELKGFFAISIYTAINKQPNVCSCWQKMEPFLWCP